ncbi:unnamed protein product [Coregonus sp. 'balchen']|nr:unnamed protein product [Coregonus sp. 'balchen']
MAPSALHIKNGLGMDEDDYYGINKGDRKSKVENAEILEMTVKKVEHILKDRPQGLYQVQLNLSRPNFLSSSETDILNREASERFAAGYIQCMHEVHMFVSNCPGIDATVAAELLNHLLESMPLNEDHFQDMVMDIISDTSSNNGSTWPAGEAVCVALASPGCRSIANGSSSALSSAASTTSSEDLCSDLYETDSEHNQSATDALENQEAQNMPTITYSKSMWRPW